AHLLSVHKEPLQPQAPEIFRSIVPVREPLPQSCPPVGTVPRGFARSRGFVGLRSTQTHRAVRLQLDLRVHRQAESPRSQVRKREMRDLPEALLSGSVGPPDHAVASGWRKVVQVRRQPQSPSDRQKAPSDSTVWPPPPAFGIAQRLALARRDEQLPRRHPALAALKAQPKSDRVPSNLGRASRHEPLLTEAPRGLA